MLTSWQNIPRIRPRT